MLAQPSPLAPSRSSSQAPRSARRPTGRTLPHRLGRYTLFDHIGRGGMADIYLASARTDLGASRLVCIKEVLPRYAASERFSEMLVAEAKLAAHLCHANVVSVEDLAREGSSLYIAMEYVEGFDLRELLRRCSSEHVPLPVEFSLLVLIEALRGLDYAHRFRGEDGRPRCIVHRDVSPSNVLISFEGEVKLCDFGIARAHDAADATAPGGGDALDDAIAGKAGYMSPEQARGDALDARADVYAAGIILWELLAGRRLYRAGEGERLLDVARVAAVPPLAKRDLPDEDALHAIVARALAKTQGERYASAAAMLRDLEQYAVGARMLASPIRFGAWLMSHFGRSIVAARRGRERALRAIERGPVAMFRPLGVAMDDVQTAAFTPMPAATASAAPATSPAQPAVDIAEETPPTSSGVHVIAASTSVEAGPIDAEASPEPTAPSMSLEPTAPSMRRRAQLEPAAAPPVRAQRRPDALAYVLAFAIILAALAYLVAAA